MAKAKTYIAQTMRVEKICIFQIDENLNAFSQAIHKLLIPDFADYGLCLDKFFVTTIVKPDGDKQYEKFKEIYFRQYADVAEAKLDQQTDLIRAQTEAQKVVIDSQAQAAKSKEQLQAEDIQDFRKRAEKLKIMKDTGLISDEEFAKIKQQMISQIL